jgi:hypothetical protein
LSRDLYCDDVQEALVALCITDGKICAVGNIYVDEIGALSSRCLRDVISKSLAHFSVGGGVVSTYWERDSEVLYVLL